MRSASWFSAFALVFVGCAASSTEDVSTTREPLKFANVKTVAQVYVEGAGALDVEGKYLPKVVCCENGGAHAEALKAQAVMARTYMYFKIYDGKVGTSAKPLTGTTADQAYFCNGSVTAACTAAVEATKDQVMTFDTSGTTFSNVAFFIDGPRPACLAKKSCSCDEPPVTTSMTPSDHPTGCDCFEFASQGAANPAYVTYNWSKSGTDVTGSTIGNPKNESNHGCASQNIQSCLGYAGWSYAAMLKFFYGQDLELRTTAGEVVPETSGSGPPTPARDGGATELPQRDDGGCGVARANAGSAWPLALACLWVVRRRRLAYRNRGTIRGSVAENSRSFKGIPYAAPPVGDLRWRPPHPAEAQFGVRDATAFGSPCMQTGHGDPATLANPTEMIGSEDCLTLNVWTPKRRGVAPLEVIVFFHGGDWIAGSSNVPRYDGAYLAEHGPAIVVTANYRLGALGFLAHEALSAEHATGTTGNYGLLDQMHQRAPRARRLPQKRVLGLDRRRTRRCSPSPTGGRRPFPARPPSEREKDLAKKMSAVVAQLAFSGDPSTEALACRATILPTTFSSRSMSRLRSSAAMAAAICGTASRSCLERRQFVLRSTSSVPPA